MAIFRIEKTRGYTVMSRHLRSAGLSLKSKGLLSMMPALPSSEGAGHHRVGDG